MHAPAPIRCPHCSWAQPLVALAGGGLACWVCGCRFRLVVFCGRLALSGGQEGGPS